MIRYSHLPFCSLDFLTLDLCCTPTFFRLGVEEARTRPLTRLDVFSVMVTLVATGRAVVMSW